MDLKERTETIVQKRNEDKLSLLEELLVLVNSICERKKLSYAAVDELLSICLDGEDRYKDQHDYRIVMAGKDYYQMIRSLTKKGNDDSKGISFRIRDYFYYKDDEPKLIITRDFPEEAGAVTVTVTLAIRQLSWLPDDPSERKRFYAEAAGTGKLNHIRAVHTLRNMQRISRRITGSNTELRDRQMAGSLAKASPSLTKYRDTGYVGQVEQTIGPVIPAADLFPVGKKDFRHTYLMVPGRPDALRYLDDHEIRDRLDRSRVRSLSRFDDFCAKNSLTYFAVKDLLTEISSGGRFPEKRGFAWSVGMLREDYDKAVALLRDEDTSEGLLLMENRPGFPLIPDLVKRFILKEEEYCSVEGYPAWIELLPYDRITGDYRESFRVKDRIRAQAKEYNRCLPYERGTSEPQKGKNLIGIGDVIRRYEEMVTASREDSTASRVFQASTEIGKNVPVNEILPVNKKQWKGINVSLPYNPYLWADPQDEGYTEYLSEGKTRVLKILDRICEEQGLPYFATADLLVAAYVYHDAIPCGGTKSFSIGLLRRDYEKLLAYLRIHGPEYGIQLNEFRDPQGQYPLLTKHVTEKDRGDWLMMVRLHPYDKVPASFYTRKAFLDQIKIYNQEYEELLDFQLNTIRKYDQQYSKEEIAERKDRYNKMNALELAEKIDTFSRKYNEDPEPGGYQRIAFAFSGKLVDKDSIIHRTHLQFRDMELTCLGDVTPWYQPMDEELKRQIRVMQRENKRLLIEFDRVCRKIGVEYFLCAGSLLGYVRHGGFIPWDDDVDIGMLRADYDRLLAEGPKEFGADFFLQTRETDPNIPYVYSKLRLNNTEYFTDYTYDRDFHKGISIDIFPHDYVPNDLEEREKQIREATKYSLAHNAIARNQYPDKEVPFPPRNEEEERIEREQKALIADYWKMSLKDSQQAYLNVATRYNAKAGEMGLRTVASFVVNYTCIDLVDLFPLQKGLFEGIEVFVPKYPHNLMKMQYGDYMKYPLPHQQVSHKVVKWSVGEEHS